MGRVNFLAKTRVMIRVIRTMSAIKKIMLYETELQQQWIWKISFEYIEELRELNNLTSDTIHEGQHLVVAYQVVVK